MKMTLVQGNGEGRFELLCFEGDDCIWEQLFDTAEEAQVHGDRYLNGDFNDGFEVKVA